MRRLRWILLAVIASRSLFSGVAGLRELGRLTRTPARRLLLDSVTRPLLATPAVCAACFLTAKALLPLDPGWLGLLASSAACLATAGPLALLLGLDPSVRRTLLGQFLARKGAQPVPSR